jgi:hypothetical protein
LCCVVVILYLTYNNWAGPVTPQHCKLRRYAKKFNASSAESNRPQNKKYATMMVPVRPLPACGITCISVQVVVAVVVWAV